MTRSTTAARCLRTAVVGVLAGLLVLLPSAGVQAAGTGGVELSPYPGVVDGKQVTAFHVTVPRGGGTTSVRYALRNTTNQPKSARLYAAKAQRDGGSWAVGDAGSSPYLDFPDRTVTLRAGEVQLASFTVHGSITEEVFGALVVEVTNGSVKQRAATLVYLKPGRRVPLPVLVVGCAVLLLLVAAGAVALARRRPATQG
ncbi:MAG TPA: hypothetical protein VM097_12165 [Mycobacteriales bacterium]|nr:hypothetical protein [Mycobacteriales bacterium]